MSSRENLTPAVLTSIGVTLSLLVGVLALRRGGWLRRPAGSRRHPGFWVVALGGWLLAAACFAGAATDWRFDWYHFRPTRSLLREVVADDPLGAPRAWRELSRRRKSGTLPEWAEQELADDALAEQAKPSASQGRLHPELLNYFADRFLAGELDESRSARFFARAVTLDFRARPAVRCGDGVPAVVTVESTLPRHGGWSYEAVSTDVWLDDVRLPGEGLRDLDRRLVQAIPVGQFDLPPITSPGRHVLRARWRVRFYFGPRGANGPADPCYVRDQVEQRPIFAVPPDSDDDVTLVERPVLAAELREKVRVTNANTADRRHAFGGRPAVDVGYDGLPVPVAFEVFVRRDGAEYPLGTFAGASTPASSGGAPFPDASAEPGAVERVDVVLRPSRAAARRTIDLTEIWGGELVFPGVVIGAAAPHGAP